MRFQHFFQSGLANFSLLEETAERYLKDPNALDPSWRHFFEGFEFATFDDKDFQNQKIADSFRIFGLIYAYRRYAHLASKSNPLELQENKKVEYLDLENLGFEESELKKTFPTLGLLDEESALLEDILSVLKKSYCSDIGFEYMDLQNPKLEKFIQKKVEGSDFFDHLSIEDTKMILQYLNHSELFESFLHTKYSGQKRFSLEGAETLIPMMAYLIENGANQGVEEFFLGMAHRGRLNVLANILQKSYLDIFNEFEENYIPDTVEGGGDVKYHKGFSSLFPTKMGKKIPITLAANPSHLESVNPVVQGMVRARQVQLGDDVQMSRIIPLTIHGDAAFTGQGVVYETFQLSQLEGYGVGGTLHIIVNNQIGFTTLPKDARSTYYCSDLAKAFGSPVFHVNAENPEACIYAIKLALEIRQVFHIDVVIDLICYRKYGHNEGDEPAFTQPLETQFLKKRKSIREIYRDILIQRGILEKRMAQKLEEQFNENLRQCLVQVRQPSREKKLSSQRNKSSYSKAKHKISRACSTRVKKKTLFELAERISLIPSDYQIHRKVEHLLSIRKKMVYAQENEKSIDWAMAEQLTYAFLLEEGTHVRLSGQDSQRGTFSHRHAVWVDQGNARKYLPLSHIKDDQGRFDVFNSPLSEYAVLGFEYGYSLIYNQALVIWEAQFGDFSNGAQIIIDQYICTGEQKWNISSPLVLLLPHGYEGQGPEHSSARIERFLQLAGAKNIQVCEPSTPAQFFHLLRRQVLFDHCKPLIVFTPKSLLRHPKCKSDLNAFTQGSFLEVLDDPQPCVHPKRLVFCSGKIYYDLLEERNKRCIKDIVLLRIEQMYPFHHALVQNLIDKYRGFEACYWVQDEPENMGAWDFIASKLRRHLPSTVELTYIGRKRSASPAEGSFMCHKKQHESLLKQLFEG